MRAPRSIPAALRGLSLLALVATLGLAGCSIKDATFTPGGGSGSGDDAAVDDAGVDAPPAGPPSWVVDLPSTTITEGTTRTFTVALTAQPQTAMLVNIATSDDAKLGVTPTALLFTGPDWNTPKTVTLTGKSDSDVADETISLTLTSDAIQLPYTADLLVDDDDGLALQLSATTLDVSEGGTGTLDVALTAQPASDVTVTVMVGNAAAAQVSLGTLTFTPANWMIPQSLSISGLQDADTANVTTMITLSSPDLTMATVAVQITDDDVLGIALSTTATTIQEGASETLSVVLTQQPSDAVTIAVASSSTAVATASTSTLTFTTTDWDIPQQVSIDAQQDDDVASGAATITFSSTGLSPRALAVTVTEDDTQEIVALPVATVVEGATGAHNVRLRYKPAGDVTVSVSSLNPSVATVTPATLTFSPTNYTMNQPITISTSQDVDVVDGSTTVRLEAPAQGLQTDVAVTVDDDDTLALDLAATTSALTEGQTGTVGVRLSHQPTATTTVTISSSDNGAASATSSLSFTTANWNTFQDVRISAVEDPDLRDETATVTLTSAGLADRTIAVTVDDNDTQAIVATPSPLPVTEGQTANLSVRLAFEPDANVTVSVASNNTAAATVPATMLTFTSANYATAQTVTVTAVEDADALASTATLALTATGINTTNVTVNVTDNDALNIDLAPTAITIAEAGTGTLNVRLTAAPAANTTVTIATSDAGAATVSPTTLTFTTTNWMTTQPVTVSGVNDVDAASETVTVTASSGVLTPRTATVTVTDDDPLNILASVASVAVTEGSTGMFGVTLTAQPAANVTVTVASTDAGAATVSPATLTFTAANWNTSQAVTVTGVQDNDVAAETVTINLTATGVGADSVTANIAEDDTQAVKLKATTLTVIEGDTGTLDASLAFQPSANVTVNVASANTGVATVTPVTLTFTPTNWSTTQAVAVTGVDDVNTADAMTTVGFTATGVTGATGTVTVDDQDVVALVLSRTTMTIGEAGSGTFTVALSHQPAASVTVNLSSNDTGAATVSPATMTFTTSNWSTAQTATVTGVADADANNETVTISAAATGITTRTVTATVTDDEVQSLIVSTTEVAPVEAGSSTVANPDSFTVRLAAQPAANVTVSIANNATGAVSLSTTSLTFTPANYATEQTVTVSAVADTDYNFELATLTVASIGLTSRQISATAVEPDIIDVTDSLGALCPGDSDTQPIGLRGNPAGSLTLSISDNLTTITLSPTSMTFSSLNYTVDKLLTVENAGFSTGTATISIRGPTGLGVVTRTVTVSAASSSSPICGGIEPI